MMLERDIILGADSESEGHASSVCGGRGLHPFYVPELKAGARYDVAIHEQYEWMRPTAQCDVYLKQVHLLLTDPLIEEATVPVSAADAHLARLVPLFMRFSLDGRCLIEVPEYMFRTGGRCGVPYNPRSEYRVEFRYEGPGHVKPFRFNVALTLCQVPKPHVPQVPLMERVGRFLVWFSGSSGDPSGIKR